MSVCAMTSVPLGCAPRIKMSPIDNLVNKEGPISAARYISGGLLECLPGSVILKLYESAAAV